MFPEPSPPDAHLPILLHVSGRRCVVVGAGRVGERKVRGLLESGADDVLVVAPEATNAVTEWAQGGRLRWERRTYRAEDVGDALLVFAATGSRAVNDIIAADARAAGALVNAVDRSRGSDFMGASVIRRGSLQVAISSGGGSPAYVRMLRQKLEAVIGPEHEAFAAYLQSLRPRVHERFPEDADRRESVWRTLATPEVLELARRNRWADIDALVAQCLS